MKNIETIFYKDSKFTIKIKKITNLKLKKENTFILIENKDKKREFTFGFLTNLITYIERYYETYNTVNLWEKYKEYSEKGDDYYEK